MKILFIFYDSPNNYGGPIVNARRLLPELRKHGFDVHCLIFYLEGDAPSAAYLKQKGVHCHLQIYGRYTEKQITWILQKVFEIQPDIFVPNLSVAGWFAARWVRESGIPTIACQRSDDTYHWAMVDEFVTGDPKWAVSGLVCVNEDLRQRVADREPKHTKLCVIPSGVPIPEHRSSQDGPLKLVYVGRLVQPAKRVIELVDSLALTLHAHPEMTADLIGEGPERTVIEKRIAHFRLQERLRLKGTLPSEEIQASLGKYHVLVLLSDFEGTPGAVMDGMAAGLVPVCLNIRGGIRELVTHEHTGLLVGDRGPAFTDAIHRLATDASLRRRLSENARNHVAQNFSLKIAVKRWKGFCGELMRAELDRKPLLRPKVFALPPPQPGLDREDRRMGSLPARLFKVLMRPIKQIQLRAIP